jgi:hypothetical protein
MVKEYQYMPEPSMLDILVLISSASVDSYFSIVLILDDSLTVVDIICLYERWSVTMKAFP